MPPNLQETADLDIFTEEIFNRKLHVLCSAHHSASFGDHRYYDSRGRPKS